MNKRRVVATGIGMITSCGRGWQPYWSAALEAKSHINYLRQISLNGFPSKLGGEISDFEPSKMIKNRKSLKVMSKAIMFAVVASEYAMADSGVALNQVDLTRFGVSLGTGIINNDLDELATGIREGLDDSGKFDMGLFGQHGLRSLFPLLFLKYLPNMPACHISITHGLKGPSNTITTSAAAGTQAIGEAFRVIERGDADMMLAGSTDSKLNAMGISRFHLLGFLSRRNHVPATAYCPFDENHDGIILGEGAGLLMLEELEHAKARGAKIYGEIKGYGSSSDFIHDPRATGDFTGKCFSMKRALKDASREPSEVDAIFANGSGIPLEDSQEVQAIHDVFEKKTDKLRVTGLKPITGHLIYGSGGVECAATLLSLQNQIIPPLANLKKPHRDCELPFVCEVPQAGNFRTLLFNSFGFGGQDASLVVAKYESR